MGQIGNMIGWVSFQISSLTRVKFKKMTEKSSISNAHEIQEENLVLYYKIIFICFPT